MNISTIKHLIADGKTELAIEEFQVSPVDNKYENSIIMLKTRYDNLKVKNIKGIISNSDFTLELNSINNDILELLTSIDAAKSNISINDIQKLPNIILSYIDNNYILEMSDEILEVIYSEIMFHIEEGREDLFTVEIMNWKTHTELIDKCRKLLIDNTNLIEDLTKQNDTIENRKEIVNLKTHSKKLVKVLNMFDVYKTDLIQKLKLFNKIIINASTNDIIEIFRWIIITTYNPSSIRTWSNGENLLTKNKEDLSIAIFKDYNPKIAFNIWVKEEDLKTHYGFDEAFHENPSIYLYYKNATSLPRNIINQKVYPMLIEEVFALYKRQIDEVNNKEYLFSMGVIPI